MEEFTSRNEGRSHLRFGGLTISGIAAIAAVALILIGLSGVAPVLLMSIASIFLGIGFLLGTGDTGYRISGDIPGIGTDRPAAANGASFNALAGLAGIVVGILSLIGISPQILLPSAAITFGCARLLESMPAGSTSGMMQEGTGINMICGAAAVVLGILALSDYSPAVLTFVAFLAVGCSYLLTDTPLVQRATSALNRKF